MKIHPTFSEPYFIIGLIWVKYITYPTECINTMSNGKMLKQNMRSRERVEKFIDEVESKTGIKLTLAQAEARLTELGYEKYQEEDKTM